MTAMDFGEKIGASRSNSAAGAAACLDIFSTGITHVVMACHGL
jgi:hypothetical protein